MQLVQVNCPECKADLKVDSKKYSAVCNICLTKFTVEVAMMMYRRNLENNNKNNIENIEDKENK